MRTIHRYILTDYVINFLMTLGVITFVLCLSVIIKAIDVAARGVSAGLIVHIFMINIPYMLTMSIPVSVLVSSLLLFGRLSFDGELTAMRASGMSLWGIIAPIVIFGVVCSAICTYINIDLAPRCKQASRDVLQRIGKEEPINLLEPGRFIQDFPGMDIRVGTRDGNDVEDVDVYEYNGEGEKIGELRAERGALRMDDKSNQMIVGLYNVRGEQKGKPFFSSYLEYKIDFAELQKKPRKKKHSDMVLAELITNIKDVRQAYRGYSAEDLAKQKMVMILEVNRRFALAMSCFAFTLIAIPLGMKSKRKESSVGIGIALGVVALFYLFIMLAEGLVKYPAWRPDLVIWLPVIMSELAGFYLIYRQN